MVFISTRGDETKGREWSQGEMKGLRGELWSTGDSEGHVVQRKPRESDMHGLESAQLSAGTPEHKQGSWERQPPTPGALGC